MRVRETGFVEFTNTVHSTLKKMLFDRYIYTLGSGARVPFRVKEMPASMSLKFSGHASRAHASQTPPSKV